MIIKTNNYLCVKIIFKYILSKIIIYGDSISVQKEESITPVESAKRAGSSLTLMIVFIVLYIVIAAGLQYVMTMFKVISYFKYVNAVLVLAFGWYIVNYFSNFIYWTVRAESFLMLIEIFLSVTINKPFAFIGAMSKRVRLI
ncbi:MAG: hypothetical protein RXS19_07180 [Caldisphaera sp.]